MSSDKYCCVPGCRDSGAMHRVLHGFPNPKKEQERFNMWLYAVGNGLLGLENEQIHKYRRVCHSHFKDEYLCRNNKISNIAVPTLHMQAPLMLKSLSGKRKRTQTIMNLMKPSTSPEDHSARATHDLNTDPNTDKELIDHDYCKSNDILRELQPDPEVTADVSIKKYDHNLKSNNSIAKNTELTYADNEFDDLGFDDLSTNDDTRDKNDKMGNYDVLLADDDVEDIFPMCDIKAEVPVIPKDSGGDENDYYIPKEHLGFRCNVCLGKIVGFRYRCCECEDYDMCSDCENRQQHPQHYVLRVPGNREQTEIRRVLAAVHLSLALPPDLKEELTIKIEDPIHEQPPDPLDTDGADPALLEPVNLEQMDTDSPTNLDASLHACSLTWEPAHLTAKKPRVIPKNKNSILKIVEADQSDIPVVVDTLKRKAIIRLRNLASPIQEKAKNPAHTESLHDLHRRKEISKHPNDQPVLKNTRDSSENVPATIYSEDPSSTHNIPPKSKSTTICLPQIRESIQGVSFPQNVLKNRKKILVAEPAEDLMEINGEKVFHMSVEEFNALMAKHDNVVIWNDKTLLSYPPVWRK